MSYIATKLAILVPVLNFLGQMIKKWLFPDDLEKISKLPRIRAVFLRLFSTKKHITILILSLAFILSTVWGFVRSEYSGWRLVLDAVVYEGLPQGLMIGLSAMGIFDTVHSDPGRRRQVSENFKEIFKTVLLEVLVVLFLPLVLICCVIVGGRSSADSAQMTDQQIFEELESLLEDQLTTSQTRQESLQSLRIMLESSLTQLVVLKTQLQTLQGDSMTLKSSLSDLSMNLELISTGLRESESLLLSLS